MTRDEIETSGNAVDVEISAVLTRMKGLSSAGIVQALADIGMDSVTYATELKRLYDGTDEIHYQQKLLSMIADLMKQKEGLKVVVENDVSAASDAELAAIKQSVTQEIFGLLEGRNGEAAIIDITEGGRSSLALPTAEDRPPARSGDGEGEERLRDVETIQANADPGKIPPIPSTYKGVTRRESLRQNNKRGSRAGVVGDGSASIQEGSEKPQNNGRVERLEHDLGPDVGEVVKTGRRKVRRR